MDEQMLNEPGLDYNASYTYADYLRWTIEERIELIKGKIFKMSPAPSSIHQTLSGRIHGPLWAFLEDKKCQVFSAPFDVRLPGKSAADEDITTVVQPDICVICDPEKINNNGCLGAPDIVVEILSPGNIAKELNNKYEVYEEAGVKEYWVVSQQDKTFLVYTLVNGKYQASRLMTNGIITTPILPGYQLSLDRLFK
jgi:Uma2 family endonuclease